MTFTATGLTGSPTTITMIAGNSQSATVNTAVATAPRVRVTDIYGNGVAGVAVGFAVVAGGGSVTGAAPTTDADGYAAVGSWILGTTAGTNTLTATSLGLSGSPMTFTATGTAGLSSKYVVSSSNYSPADRLRRDHHGAARRPVRQPRRHRRAPGDVQQEPEHSGTLSGASPATNGATAWRPSPSRWVMTVGHRVHGHRHDREPTPARTGTTPAITTIAATPTRIAMNAGNNQSATVNTAVATAPSVLVTDAYNNPVSGVAVTLRGRPPAAARVTGASATTNASGIATVGSWTLGTTAGANTLTATCGGLTGSPVTFTATGLAGPATRYVVTSSNYSPVAGSTITLSAQLADQYGNPVATSGIRVTFSKTGNGGRFSSTRANTNAAGVATTTFTTSRTVGRVYTFTARSTSGGTRTGTSAAVTTVAGAPTRMTLSAGNNQTATAGTAVATAPSVRVRDAERQQRAPEWSSPSP